MDQVRKLAEIGHSSRKEHKIKVRQPLSSFTYGKEFRKLPRALESILKVELNAKKVEYKKSHPFSFEWELKLTPELKKEGEARDLIRKIQERRKEAKVAFNDTVTVYLPSWPQEYEEFIRRETLAKKLIKGESISVERN